MNSIKLLPADRPDQAQIVRCPLVAGPQNDSSPWRSWVTVAVLTAALTGVSSYQSIRRYQDLRSGWSWDLAYYNQWFWASDTRRRNTDRPTHLGVRPGRAVDLEDELPHSDPAGACAALPSGSRAAAPCS